MTEPFGQATVKLRAATAIALLGSVALFLAHAALYRGFIVDDAFITFRYVQQWIHGHGLVYNVGERVEGYSNFLWIVLLTPLARWGLDLVLVAKGLGLLLSLLTLCLTWRISRTLEGPKVAVWFLASSGPFAAWAMGGLETLLFTFLLFLSGIAFMDEEKHDRGYVSGILWGLLALTRPEGVIFALMAIVFRLWRVHTRQSHLRAGDYLRLILFGSLVLPYFLWRWTYYGYPLPNTVYAKSLDLHPRAFLEGVVYLYKCLESTGGFFFIALLILLTLVVPPFSLTVRYWILNISIYVLFLLLGGGDWMPMQRFWVHILPPLSLLWQIGLGRLEKLTRSHWRTLAMPALIIGQVGFLLGFSLEQRFVHGVGEGPLIPEDTPTVTYLRQHIGPTDTIAVVDAGFIAYRLPIETRVIDMVGLTDAHIAHRPVQLPGGLWGRGDAFGKWDVDYVLTQNPRFIQVNIVGKTPDGEWLTNFTGTTLLVNDPRFRRAYERVEAPGVSGIFRRRE